MARCTAPINGHRTASGRAIARYVEVEVIEIGILIPHILQHILHQQAVRGVVVAVDKPRRKHVGLRVVPRYYILLQEIRTLTPVRANIEKRSELPDLQRLFSVSRLGDQAKV